MPDIATLGIAVDSSQADKGALALSKLSNAARHAEAATKGVTTGARGAAAAAAAISGASSNAAAALDREAAAARRAAQAMNAHGIAMNDNVRRMGGSMSGLAAQFQDIGVTAAMDMNPMIIALQQGTQIAGQLEAAMQGGGSAVSVLGEAFKSLFSPLTIVTIALTALAAAGLQMVDWPGLAAAALNGLADVLVTIAPYAIAAAAGLALLYAPALLAGLTFLSEAILTITARLIGLAAGFALANPAVAFVAGITAAVAAAAIFRGELTQILGVDVVGAAKDGANLVIGSFVAAFEDLKFVWNQFPNIVGAAAVGAANAALSAMERMINAASGMLNGLIQSLNGALSQLPGDFQIGEIGTVDFGQVANPYADALSSAVGERNKAVQDALGRDYLGDFGGAISRGASAASTKLKELAKDITAVDDKSKNKGGAKTDADHYQDIVDGADRQIAALLAEQAALGMTEEAAAALRYEQDLLNDAQQRGIDLTPQQAGYFKMLAGTMAGLEAGIRKAQEAMAFAKDVTRGFIDDFRNGLEQGKGFWESFGSAALGVLDRITDKLLNDVLDALFQVNSAGSAGGGIFGTIVGGIGKLLGFANGGYTGPGGKYEPAGVVHRGEYVFSAAATRALGVTNLDRMHKRAKGYAEGGYVGPVSPRMQSPANANGAQNVHVTVGVSVDRNGNLQAYVKDVAQQEAGQAGATMLENYRRFGVKDDIEAFQQDPRRFG